MGSNDVYPDDESFVVGNGEMRQAQEVATEGGRLRPCSGVLLMVALITVSAGCDSERSRAVLYQGRIGPGHNRVAHRVSDSAARHGGQLARTQWEYEIRNRAREAPREHFANLSAATLRERLREAADEHGLEVVSVNLLRPRQLAPEIIVRTTDYLGLAHTLPGILHKLDPHEGSSDTRGWSYEAFFIEARDERGVPFLAVFNHWRGQHKGGGQWARSEALYPFLHG
jgi:hypothetical protein